ncbi:MAG: hypothetical protein CVU46_16560 [Chloroflexi bacterium HGW-Chloroflexi-8]|nr:MAG: hypothetical protein CVU46_16560 [Chloroflexi bacterium HGW-Chloroflexi-8]
MTEESFWDLYWETRLGFLQGQGKGHAILAASRIIRSNPFQPMRILELGCGEGQILGALVQAHPQASNIQESIGVDYDLGSLETARKDYPGIQFIHGDFTNREFLTNLGNFDLILLVNALHHVYSDAYDEELGEVDVPTAKTQVREAFIAILERLNSGGSLLLFDGLEMDGDTRRPVEIRFLQAEAQEAFHQFAREYQPFRIRFTAGALHAHKDTIQLSIRDFTRYVTKLIFLGKPLWERERLESYQYFNQEEMLNLFQENSLILTEKQLISVDLQRWQEEIEILSPDIDFPIEHILLIGKKM